VDALTIPQYELLMKAVRLREVDKNYRNHLQAFLNFAVKASNKKGVPRFKKFERFYNYQKDIENAEKPQGGRKSALPDMSRFFKKGE
jgi:hypothetical protein